MGDNAHLYKAFPLLSPATNIRLLLLQPGSWTDTIQCTFKIVPLTSPYPQYEGLSYVWGTHPLRWEISVSGHKAKVTNNLYKALYRLRKATEVRTLWVDALCINQADNAEKAFQVTKMAEIYTNCKEVWIFLNDYETEPLGPRDTRTIEETTDLVWDGEPAAFPIDGGYSAFASVWEFSMAEERHLNEMPLFTTVESPNGPLLRVASENAKRGLEALFDIMGLDWWRRIWVVQEAVLPPKATLVLGSISILFELFTKAAMYLENHSRCCGRLLLTMPGLARLTERFILAVMQIGWTRLHHRGATGGPLQIYDLLWQYRCHDATDGRDKVFALLSFMRDREALIELAPNYDISKKEIYRRTVEFSIRTSKRLFILQGQRTPTPSTSMPSWIYDWSLPKEIMQWNYERYRLRQGQFSASGDVEPSISCDDEYALSLKGICIDIVVAVGATMNDSRAQIVSDWRHLADFSTLDRRQYIANDENSVTAFWRTITRDNTITANKTFERIQDYEDHILSASTWWDNNLTVEHSEANPRTDFDSLLGNISAGLQFFMTAKGYIGMGNPSPGDEVFVLMGGEVPFLLRHGPEPNSDYFLVVGDCYLHGIMDGEMAGGDWSDIVLH